MRALPLDACRDLLGILRLLYAAERESTRPSPRRLRDIQRVAHELTEAMADSVRAKPGSDAHYAARERANGVVARLADLVGVTDSALPVLLVAGERIRRQMPAKRPAPELPTWACGKRGERK